VTFFLIFPIFQRIRLPCSGCFPFELSSGCSPTPVILRRQHITVIDEGPHFASYFQNGFPYPSRGVSHRFPFKSFSSYVKVPSQVHSAPPPLLPPRKIFVSLDPLPSPRPSSEICKVAWTLRDLLEYLN